MQCIPTAGGAPVRVLSPSTHAPLGWNTPRGSPQHQSPGRVSPTLGRKVQHSGGSLHLPTGAPGVVAAQQSSARADKPTVWPLPLPRAEPSAHSARGASRVDELSSSNRSLESHPGLGHSAPRKRGASATAVSSAASPVDSRHASNSAAVDPRHASTPAPAAQCSTRVQDIPKGILGVPAVQQGVPAAQEYARSSSVSDIASATNDDDSARRIAQLQHTRQELERELALHNAGGGRSDDDRHRLRGLVDQVQGMLREIINVGCVDALEDRTRQVEDAAFSADTGKMASSASMSTSLNASAPALPAQALAKAPFLNPASPLSTMRITGGAAGVGAPQGCPAVTAFKANGAAVGIDPLQVEAMLYAHPQGEGHLGDRRISRRSPQHMRPWVWQEGPPRYRTGADGLSNSMDSSVSRSVPIDPATSSSDPGCSTPGHGIAQNAEAGIGVIASLTQTAEACRRSEAIFVDYAEGDSPRRGAQAVDVDSPRVSSKSRSQTLLEDERAEVASRQLSGSDSEYHSCTSGLESSPRSPRRQRVESAPDGHDPFAAAWQPQTATSRVSPRRQRAESAPDGHDPFAAACQQQRLASPRESTGMESGYSEIDEATPRDSSTAQGHRSVRPSNSLRALKKAPSQSKACIADLGPAPRMPGLSSAGMSPRSGRATTPIYKQAGARNTPRSRRSAQSPTGVDNGTSYPFGSSAERFPSARSGSNAGRSVMQQQRRLSPAVQMPVATPRKSSSKSPSPSRGSTPLQQHGVRSQRRPQSPRGQESHLADSRRSLGVRNGSRTSLSHDFQAEQERGQDRTNTRPIGAGIQSPREQSRPNEATLQARLSAAMKAEKQNMLPGAADKWKVLQLFYESIPRAYVRVERIDRIVSLSNYFGFVSATEFDECEVRYYVPAGPSQLARLQDAGFCRDDCEEMQDSGFGIPVYAQASDAYKRACAQYNLLEDRQGGEKCLGVALCRSGAGRRLGTYGDVDGNAGASQRLPSECCVTDPGHLLLAYIIWCVQLSSSGE